MATTTVVSQQTVATIAAALTTAGMDGRAIGTDGHAQAQTYLVDWLRQHGLTPLGATSGSYLQPFEQGANILALVPGTAGGQTPRVLISAHYDHMGHDCRHHPTSTVAVCNGAADDAGGVAVVLAAAEALAGQLAEPVAIAIWDAEEEGLLGSTYFTAHPTFALEGLRLAIDMDIVGLNTFRGLEAQHYAIGSETGGARLQADVLAAAPDSLKLSRLSYAFGHARSDLTSFVAAGWQVPFVLFSDGDGSVYHSDADDFGHLNLEKVHGVAVTVAQLAASASRAEAGYEFHAPFQAAGHFLPLPADAAAIQAVLGKLAAAAAANELGAEAQRELAARRTRVEAIVAAGPAAFDQRAMLDLAETARWVLALSRGLTFVP